jgi:hypothetical protein
MRNLDRDKLGVIIVSSREDGTYWVIDGQHRVAALKALGDTDPVTCVVYDGLTTDREAKMFTAQGDSRRIHPIDLFYAKVAAGDPESVQINQIIGDSGFNFNYYRKKADTIQAPTTIIEITRRGGYDHLTDVLSIIGDVWFNQDTAVPAFMLGGVSAFTMHYGVNGYHRDHLIDTLRATSVEDLSALSMEFGEGVHIRKPLAYGRAMAELYNQTLTDGVAPLPAWGRKPRPVAEDHKGNGN